MKAKRMVSILMSVLMTGMLFPVSTSAEDTAEAPVPAPAAGRQAENRPVSESDFEFDADLGTITGYHGEGGDIEIPSAIDGITVLAIGDCAFEYNDGITGVSIPDGVTSIGAWAFYGCINLKRVTIPASVDSLGWCAFEGCSEMLVIMFDGTEERWTEIGGEDANPDNRPVITTDESPESDFDFNPFLGTITGYNGDGGNILIPSTIDGVTVTAIEDSVFENNENITFVKIPAGVTSIGGSAFESCDFLSTVIIFGSSVSIGSSAFSSCANLEHVYITGSVTRIGGWAFADCQNLKSINLPNGLSEIGDNAFNSCEQLETITIPSSASRIGEGAFSYCSDLTISFHGTEERWAEIGGSQSGAEHVDYDTDGLCSIYVDDGITNGTIMVQPYSEVGADVRVTVTPEEDYDLDTLTVNDGSADLPVTKVDDTEYVFIMPKNDVTVTATFKEVTKYPLWVGVDRVTSDKLEGEGWSYNPASNTLALCNADITGRHVYDTDEYGNPITANIYAENDLVIELSGTNTIDGARRAIEAQSLSISGGELTVHGSDCGIETDGDIEIRDSHVTVSGDSGICAYYAYSDNIMIEDSNVSISSFLDGIFTYGSVSIRNSSVDVSSLNSFALQAGEGIIIEDAEIVKPAGGTISTYYGWYVIFDSNGNKAKEVEIKSLPAFTTQSLVLGGLIGVKFYMNLPERDDINYEDSYMTFAIDCAGNPESTVNYTAGQNYFTCKIKSIQMADEITAIYHYRVTGEDEERTIEKTYAAVDYFTAFDEAVEEGYIDDPTTIDLVYALADYGHYVQAFLQSTKGWEFGKDYTKQDKHYTEEYSIADVTAGVAEEGASTTILGNDIDAVTQTLTLDSETTISVYFKPVGRFSSFTASAVDVNGNTVNCVIKKVSGGKYKVSIPGVSAHKLSRRYLITANADNTEATVNISALSYVKAMLDYYEDDAIAENAAAAIYYYAKAADAYMAGH